MKRNLKNQKNDWIQCYAERMFNAWSMQKSPFGISSDYLGFCRNYLADFCNDPLKRMFIEKSYQLI